MSVNFRKKFIHSSVSSWSLRMGMEISVIGLVVGVLGENAKVIGSIHGNETFCHLSYSSQYDEQNWFFMHKQNLPEEDECAQASHYNITGLRVVNLMGKKFAVFFNPLCNCNFCQHMGLLGLLQTVRTRRFCMHLLTI